MKRSKQEEEPDSAHHAYISYNVKLPFRGGMPPRQTVVFMMEARAIRHAKQAMFGDDHNTMSSQEIESYNSMAGANPRTIINLIQTTEDFFWKVWVERVDIRCLKEYFDLYFK